MNIKRKFQIIYILPLVLAAILILILFSSYATVSEIMKQDRLGEAIVRGVFDLNIRTNEYIIMMHPSERPKQQWLFKYDSTSNLLDRMEFEGAEERTLLMKIRHGHQRIRGHFQKLVDIYESPESLQQMGDINPAYQELVRNQLLVESETMVSDTAHLTDLIHASFMKYYKWVSIIIVCSVLILLLILFVVSALTRRSIVAPILRLHQATEVIAGGNLDHRSGIETSDELGQLSRAFDDMTLKLKNSRIMLKDEISEHKKAEQSLQKEKEKLQKYLDISAVMVVMLDTDQKVSLINKKGCDILGFDAEEIIGSNWFDNFLPERLRDEVKIVFNKLMAGKIESVEYYENKVLTKNGEERLIAWYNTVFRDKEGNITNTLGAGVDITDSRNAEMQIKASLKEKEMLLQEIHHRVKNNMTVIHSMLELQSGYIKDIRYKDMFRESMARIKSMALIHEKLYRSKDLASINFSEYISDMTDDIYISYGLNSGKVRLKKHIDQITLGIDTAIPCGLIVNELLSNSLKYAFPEGMEGEITVALCMNDKEEVELTVGDNGVGMPEELDYGKTGSLGLSLINALVKQIQGKIELDKEKGTEIRIRFRRR